MAGFEFSNPGFLVLLTSIPLLIATHILLLRHTRRKAMLFANFDAIERITGKTILQKNYLLLTLRILTLIFMILAVAGTSFWYVGQKSNFVYTLAIDTSSSMLAEDFDPNRLDSAKIEAANFIDKLPSNSKLAIISFSGVSKTEIPLTSNSELLKQKINNLTISSIGGTDIGSALITATNLLMTEKRPKVVVLLTDGISTVGVDVSDGITYAKQKNVLVYTIGIGSEEGGGFEGLNLTSKLDVKTLQKISNRTLGKFYRAETLKDLQDAYTEIAESADAKIDVNLQPPLFLAALLIVFYEWGLINTRFRTLP